MQVCFCLSIFVAASGCLVLVSLSCCVRRSMFAHSTKHEHRSCSCIHVAHVHMGRVLNDYTFVWVCCFVSVAGRAIEHAFYLLMERGESDGEIKSDYNCKARD
jgi:hypothetical protein